MAPIYMYAHAHTGGYTLRDLWLQGACERVVVPLNHLGIVVPRCLWKDFGCLRIPEDSTETRDISTCNDNEMKLLLLLYTHRKYSDLNT